MTNAAMLEASDSKEGVAVTTKNLSKIAQQGVAVPKYDRSSVRAGILHLSAGNFHRAHQCVYLDSLFELGLGHEYGIIGAGLLDIDAPLADALDKQDTLFTVTERSSSKSATKVIGSMTKYLRGFKDWRSVVSAIADKDIKIITMTITESGYFVDKASGAIIFENPAIEHDLQTAGKDAPKTAYGYLYAGLKERFEKGATPPTLLSCDNLQGNGDVLKKCLLSFVAKLDAELAKKIESTISFPNCMVDRITPRATPEDTRAIIEKYEVIDSAPVVCEDFLQWVVEDHFVSGRPPLEKVGVQFTNDVKPYEKMKLRLLNAGHSSMGYLGYLMGHRYIYEIAADADCAAYTRKFMDSEATPTLDSLPGVDFTKYKNTLLSRFANPHIKDQALRICSDGSGKIPGFVLPTVRDCLDKNLPIECAALLVASWIRFLNGKDEAGHDIPLEDPMAESLRLIAVKSGRDARGVLGIETIFGALGNNPGFVSAVQSSLDSLYDIGARATVQKILKGK